MNQDELAIRLLLKKGAKPDFTLKTGFFAGQSPLSCAKERGLKDMVKLLESYVEQE